VYKFDLHSGREVWREDIDVNPAAIKHYLLGDIIVAQEHIVFSARWDKPIPSVAYYIVEAESGKMVQKIEAIDKSQKRTEEMTKRLPLIGRVVMTNGRLCLETAEGITVYGGK
ncbi:MAG: hypothetical protein KAJ01_07265, partial [Candidatus Hydrogenedentes bacterium]|nr:hypothetical protein [Candidatus Hydrogenedentota bacterium]